MKICCVEGCERKHYGLEFCKLHYQRFKKYGDPLGGGTFHGDPLRFIEKTLYQDTDECIQWPYATDSSGYGNLYVNGVPNLAHRLICKRFHGEPPTGKHEAAHSCGKGHLGCINPKHLHWATHAENMKEAVKHGTMRFGADSGNAKLDDEKVLQIRSLRGEMTQKEIGLMFGIGQSTVSMIFSRQIWSWLE